MNLSSQESEFLTRLAAKGKSIISTHEAEKMWQGSTPVSLVLHRLEKKGWLHRLDRGVYLLIPLEAGPERFWSESPLVIASHLIEPAAVAYWSALLYWQMTEQLPRITFVQSTKRKRPMEIQGMPFQFVMVKNDRFFGIVERQVNDKKFRITDREKTLIDCADRPDLSGGIAQLNQALKNEYTQVDWGKVDDYFERWGGGTVIKRIGYLVDALGVPVPEREKRLNRWKASLTRGISLLEPGAGKDGPIVTSWKIRVNIHNLTALGEG
ncbi:MAG TPA: type IV toxin-antitoxin system AbiEi family antitoxin domain-containing protein [Anaerolineales bacterium]|nr:type IV toxin-antitoxin system AbiEi family antitoxin domain-containing protein [Anaerolineales bacterium]